MDTVDVTESDPAEIACSDLGKEVRGATIHQVMQRRRAGKRHGFIWQSRFRGIKNKRG